MTSLRAEEAPRRKRRGAGASLPRLLRRPVTYLLAGLTLVAGIFFTGLPSASARDCPPGKDCHFVRINQTEKMRWNAYMVMFNPKTGKRYHEWKEKHGLDGSSPKSGAHASWWWNIDRADPNVRIELTIDYKRDEYTQYPVKSCIRGTNVCGGERYETKKTTFTEKFSVDKDTEANLDPMINHCFELSPTGGVSSDKTGAECTDS